jgi:hypothetical protein
MTVGTILRDVARLRCIRDERPLRGLHLSEPAPGSADTAPGERIVPAGIQDEQVEPRPCSLHLAEHQIRIDHLKIDIRLLGRIRTHRHKIVGPTHLDAVAGVIKEGDTGSLQYVAEILYRAVEGRFIEVELRRAAHQRETQALERVGDELRVACRIGEPRHIAVLAITNHERHSALRLLRCGSPYQQ